MTCRARIRYVTAMKFNLDQTATINVVRYGRERGGRIRTSDGTTLELGWDAMLAHLRGLTPDAARGIDHLDLPASPQRVWQALQTAARD